MGARRAGTVPEDRLHKNPRKVRDHETAFSGATPSPAAKRQARGNRSGGATHPLEVQSTTAAPAPTTAAADLHGAALALRASVTDALAGIADLTPDAPEVRARGLRERLGEVLAGLLAGVGVMVTPAEVTELLTPRRSAPAATASDEDVLARVCRFAPCTIRVLRQRMPAAWGEPDARGVNPLVHALGRLEQRGLVRITRQARKSMLIEVPAPIGPPPTNGATIALP